MPKNLKRSCLAALVAVSTFTCHAQPQLVNIGSIGLAPYGIDNDGELSGIYHDLANEIAINAGYQTNSIVAPYARIIKSLKHGDIDIAIMFRNPALEGYVEYIGALPSKKTVVIGVPGNEVHNIQELQGKTITYLRGAQFSEEIDNDESIKKLLVANYMLGIKMVLAGRADAIIIPEQSLQQAIVELARIEKIKVNLGQPLVVRERSPWIQISKKSVAYLDIEKLRQSFIALQAQDRPQALKEKYTP